MSDSGWGYMGLIPVIILQRLGLGGTALALAVLTAGSFAGGIAYEKHHNSGEAIANSALSDGRAQLLKADLAGNRAEFDAAIAAQIKAHEGDFRIAITDEVNRYFAAKGLPCDPGPASSAVGDTLARAKVPCIAPPAHAP